VESGEVDLERRAGENGVKAVEGAGDDLKFPSSSTAVMASEFDKILILS
jgi:hypothetical protein